METITTYLDNMFARLPKTAQMIDLKNNIMANMEDKYDELKEAGKSEHEAIGIVISEFGNIDELVSELDINLDTKEDTRQTITKEEADTYLTEKSKSGSLIGIGVFLCFLAAASLILINQLVADQIIGKDLSSKAKDVFGLIPLFLLVAIAVGIFIYSGMKMEKYAYIEKGIHLPSSVKSYIQQKYDSYTPTYSVTVIIGVCLILISPIALFISSVMGENASTYGVVILLLMVAIAVYVFIYYGSLREGYGKLLEIDEYSNHTKKEEKVIGAVASIVFPLATCIFLFCGFVYSLWYIAWIVFPITGILFGMFSAAYSIIKGNQE